MGALREGAWRPFSFPLYPLGSSENRVTLDICIGLQIKPHNHPEGLLELFASYR